MKKIESQRIVALEAGKSIPEQLGYKQALQQMRESGKSTSSFTCKRKREEGEVMLPLAEMAMMFKKE